MMCIHVCAETQTQMYMLLHPGVSDETFKKDRNLAFVPGRACLVRVTAFPSGTSLPACKGLKRKIGIIWAL